MGKYRTTTCRQEGLMFLALTTLQRCSSPYHPPKLRAQTFKSQSEEDRKVWESLPHYMYFLGSGRKSENFFLKYTESQLVSHGWRGQYCGCRLVPLPIDTGLSLAMVLKLSTTGSRGRKKALGLRSCVRALAHYVFVWKSLKASQRIASCCLGHSWTSSRDPENSP